MALSTRRLVLAPKAVAETPIVGIIFDMDGTLCKPQTWMFQRMRDALGIDKSLDILDYVHGLPEDEQASAHLKLQAVEREAMVDMEATPGVQRLLDWVDSQGIPKAILTRNFPIPVQHLLDKVLVGHAFEPVITRDFRPPKPSPAGILAIAKTWNVDPHKLVMVGDSIDDMMAGHRAGSGTILLRTPVNEHVSGEPETDVTVENIDDIIEILEKGFTTKEKPSEPVL
ncbi:uncharacterized protein SAPINGB_P000603 [Magnusiomyces paraingens]|uniref:HAD-like protein n=1 Tax=Magnusiomyces paraingens TaxID=2606893 RepID=A0A5E8B6W2_9ASCO|nr:uncharacterized protein SAPINGB_P000603 [Saprochaete ingens]VVT44996.1 unnamed protein product [Saprochaete ingens]